MALDQNEVDKQIRQMVKFIEQESNEKADEIEMRAEEEFNIEKGRIVQQEKIKINAQYERKFKQLETKRRIAYSNELNAARLKVLQHQDEKIAEVFEEAATRLEKISKDGSKYPTLMEQLLVQGLFVLLEPEVELRVRKADIDTVKGKMDSASKQYKEKTGKSVNLVLKEDDCLADSCGGGVELSAHNGKIKCVNTLENRLKETAHQIMPAMRVKLLGTENSTRAFFD